MGITNTGRQKVCKDTGAARAPAGGLPGDTAHTASTLPTNHPLQLEGDTKEMQPMVRAWVSAGGRGSLCQALPAAYTTRRWKESHSVSHGHGTRTNLPCHQRSSPRAESWLSQLQASAAPRQSPHHGDSAAPASPRPWTLHFKRLLGFFSGCFSPTRACFWGASGADRR